MATKLHKTVTRQCLFTACRDGKHRGKVLIVALEFGDTISFRYKGTRRTVSISLGQCLKLANILDANERYNEALRDYKEKRKLGVKRLRKPKKSHIVTIHSSFYSKTL